ncbi:endonuclease domain-containing protein [Streptomyces sp. NPDC058947]|uniref:endonuclease domain-containing protein n=1 Tax=Streptomyces sp. NPDC058947 TaxID=3346675 RepID=UPI0036C2B122
MDETGHKACTGCRERKPLTDFHRDGRGGYLGRCRPCRAATRRVWRETYKERQATYRRRFQLSQYGLTEEEYDLMLAAQDGGCAMCGGACPSGRQLAVDHCHVSGRVRGLLCVRCNQALGVYEAIRDAAGGYLAAYGAGNPHISHGVALRDQRAAPRVGRRAGTSKLTDDDIRTMRQRYEAGGVTQRSLAAEYGISQNAVGLILRRRSWQHVA